MKISKNILTLIILVVAIGLLLAYHNMNRKTNSLSDVIRTNNIKLDREVLSKLKQPLNDLRPSNPPTSGPSAVELSDKDVADLYLQLEAIEKYFAENNVLENLKRPDFDESQKDQFVDALIIKQNILSKIADVQIKKNAALLAEMK